jgi:hypothetical protein
VKCIVHCLELVKGHMLLDMVQYLMTWLTNGLSGQE